MKFKTKKSLMLYCLHNIVNKLSKSNVKLSKSNKVIVKNMNIAYDKLTNKGIPSMKHQDDVSTIEAIILCEPEFITGSKRINSAIALPIFKTSQLKAIYKTTVTSLLNRLGRVRNDKVVVRSNYAQLIPQQILSLKEVLAKLSK